MEVNIGTLWNRTMCDGSAVAAPLWVVLAVKSIGRPQSRLNAQGNFSRLVFGIILLHKRGVVELTVICHAMPLTLLSCPCYSLYG